MNAPFTHARAGFTLLELMVVIAVLAILASFVGPNVFAQLGGAKASAAASQAAMLAAALDNYRLDTGSYPTTQQGLQALRTLPDGEAVANWRGPYLRAEVPLDPWGRPYFYRSPDPSTPGGAYLGSLGADGVEGGEGENADILAWR